jgi:tRNA(adenine34) deaminase
MNHELYMHIALEHAQKAYDQDEVPIGAIVVDKEGNIIGKGFNKSESCHSQTAHAELEALRQAGIFKNNWRLEECTLYVTLQPCSMCYSAIVLSRISTLVYGASSPLFGFHLDKDTFLSVYNNDKLFLVKGILENECALVLKQFFHKKRKDT